MKSILTVILALGLAIGLGGLAYADPQDDAVAEVQATVDPIMAAGVLTARVDVGGVQIGEFSALIGFRIDANTQYVDIMIEGSDLFKGDDACNQEVAPIPLVGPVGIDPVMATAQSIALGDPGARIEDVGVCGFDTLMTAGPFNRFESSQNGHFSQDVDVTLVYDLQDPEQPTGDYSGALRLTALVVPVP